MVQNESKMNRKDDMKESKYALQTPESDQKLYTDMADTQDSTDNKTRPIAEVISIGQI